MGGETGRRRTVGILSINHVCSNIIINIFHSEIILWDLHLKEFPLWPSLACAVNSDSWGTIIFKWWPICSISQTRWGAMRRGEESEGLGIRKHTYAETLLLLLLLVQTQTHIICECINTYVPPLYRLSPANMCDLYMIYGALNAAATALCWHSSKARRTGYGRSGRHDTKRFTADRLLHRSFNIIDFRGHLDGFEIRRIQQAIR